jgi:serine/threonine-protein kinase
LPGAARLRRRVHGDLIAIIRKSLAVKPRDRFADAGKMAAAWEKSRLKALRYINRQRAKT